MCYDTGLRNWDWTQISWFLTECPWPTVFHEVYNRRQIFKNRLISPWFRGINSSLKQSHISPLLLTWGCCCWHTTPADTSGTDMSQSYWHQLHGAIHSISVSTHTRHYTSSKIYPVPSLKSMTKTHECLRPPFKLLVSEALNYECMRPQATSVWGLKLRVYEALSYLCMRP